MSSRNNSGTLFVCGGSSTGTCQLGLLGPLSFEQVKEKGMNPQSVEWFTKFFKFGAPPHGGFAIGIERLTQNLLNLSNVREAVLFARDPDRLTP